MGGRNVAAPSIAAAGMNALLFSAHVTLENIWKVDS